MDLHRGCMHWPLRLAPGIYLLARGSPSSRLWSPPYPSVTLESTSKASPLVRPAPAARLRRPTQA